MFATAGMHAMPSDNHLCTADLKHIYAGAGAFVAAILINIIRAYLVKPWMRKYIPIPMCLGIPAYLVSSH